MKGLLLILLLVLPRPVTDALGDLFVQYGGRVCPMSSVLYEQADETPTLEGLRIFPLERSDGSFSWYAAGEPLPPEVLEDMPFWEFAQEAPLQWEQAVKARDWETASELIGRIREHQQKTLDGYLPPEGRMKAEKFWYRVATPKVPFMLALALGMILFLLYCLKGDARSEPGITGAVWGLTLILWLYLTLVIGLRWYLAGYGPFAGSYNVMMLMAWLVCSASLLTSKKYPIIQPVALLLAGFTLLLATRAGARITPLHPGLQSPLLSVHVLLMMLSYTLLGLVAFNGILGLLIRGEERKRHLMEMGGRILLPGWTVLLAGTVIGSIWAQSAWGSWWSWDPKETWALVTLIVYAVLIGCIKAGLLKKPVLFHILSIVAFATVLFTYFGVNLLLGGLHSYGN